MIATRHEGLYYRKNKYNKKVFIARFKIDGKEHKKVLGKEPNMNTHTANIARAELIGRMRGTIQSLSDNRNISQLFDEYVESRRSTLSESWYYNICKNYNKHLKPIIGQRLPQSIRSIEVQTIINEMLDGAYGRKYAPSTVKQIKDCMTGLFAYIQKLGYPVHNIGQELTTPSFDNKIYFTISNEKAKMLFDAILNYKDLKWRAYFIWLLHGRRKMEVAVMRWEWIDFYNMSYRVPSVANKTTKEINAPITALLKDALYRYGVKDCGFVFDGIGGGGHISSTGIDFHWRTIRQSGFIGVNSGFSLELIGSVLGHSSTATTKRYSNMKSDSARVVLSSMFDRFVESPNSE